MNPEKPSDDEMGQSEFNLATVISTANEAHRAISVLPFMFEKLCRKGQKEAAMLYMLLILHECFNYMKICGENWPDEFDKPNLKMWNEELMKTFAMFEKK